MLFIECNCKKNAIRIMLLFAAITLHFSCSETDLPIKSGDPILLSDLNVSSYHFPYTLSRDTCERMVSCHSSVSFGSDTAVATLLITDIINLYEVEVMSEEISLDTLIRLTRMKSPLNDLHDYDSIVTFKYINSDSLELKNGLYHSLREEIIENTIWSKSTCCID